MAMRKFKTARRAVARRTVRRVARPWTREEMTFMRKFYRRYETAWIARQLGRTVYSVRYKAVDMNIKKASPSVWKGNRGAANSFNRSTPKRRPTTNVKRRAKTTRKTTPKRKYRASTTRSMPRKATSRRMADRTTRRRRTTRR
ncbi:MAG: hypothetical protein DRP47_01580 [Candidatus Zixiibacteriota bacterium]|nr:MAG: hypothetical protein DRP47_01580 [candidate division Zixibacteria bacterium]